VRWQLSANTAGALAPRVLVVVSATSYHKQWSRVSFKIRAKEGHFYSNLLKIEIAR
jgi:hypothetical protein